jgi:cell division protein FtsQ
VRSAVTVYLPLAALALAGWAVVSTDRLRLALRAEVEALAERVAARPEFTVRGVEIEGASEALAAELRGLVGPVRGRSSLRLDLDALRTEIERLGAVASASVFFDPRGTLAVRVVERLPAALWRDPAGALRVLDRAGVVIGPAAHRGAHPRLPLLLGIGAPARVGEALALMRAAPALVPRLRAFARIGERRWDVVLDREMRVMLPEEGAARALKGAMALQFGEELFERDLVAVDLRLPDRPVLRLHPRAAEGDVLRRAVDLVLGEET